MKKKKKISVDAQHEQKAGTEGCADGWATGSRPAASANKYAMY